MQPSFCRMVENYFKNSVVWYSYQLCPDVVGATFAFLILNLAKSLVYFENCYVHKITFLNCLV